MPDSSNPNVGIVTAKKLTADRFYTALDSDAAELGVSPTFRSIRPRFDIHTFDCVDSTNTQLWRMLAAGYGGGTVAIAQRQSAGRGQRGRVWQSAAGGLYLSLAVAPDWPVAKAGQLTCLSAWGIAIALNNLGLPIQIKWPNDLFFEGKKLGGILTETKLAHHSDLASPDLKGSKSLPCIRQAVIGVGINWHNPTPETGISLVKILEKFPHGLAKIKINCLETLSALVLRGILQGVFFQRQVGSQVFMKDYEKLLTQFRKPVSLDRKLLEQMVFSNRSESRLRTGGLSKSVPLKAERFESDRSKALLKRQLLGQLVNRSGEVVGVSEEGYLKVALRGPPIEMPYRGSAHWKVSKRILLFAPASDTQSV